MHFLLKDPSFLGSLSFNNCHQDPPPHHPPPKKKKEPLKKPSDKLLSQDLTAEEMEMYQ